MWAFVGDAAEAGIDVCRIFDSLNYPTNILPAIEATRAAGKMAEVALCYTTDILDTGREK